MTAIDVDGLRKTYPGGVVALRGVSFRVEEGEVFGLLGPNGAGKSTTVRILATLSRAGEGTARVAGFDVEESPAGVRRRIGWVAQSSTADTGATGRENLELQARLHGMGKGDARRRAERMLERVGLSDAGDRIVSGYSGGMKRRLDLALGLVHRPRVLFLDEPTTGLDPEIRVEIWRFLERLAADEEMTILLTTHYMEEADRLSRRLAILDRGRIVARGRPDDLKEGLRGEHLAVTLEGTADPDRAEDVLAEHGLPGSVVREDRTLHLRVERGARAIPRVVSALEGKGCPVAEVALSRPSLEDVYLEATGHSFGRAGEGDEKGGEAA